MWRAVLGILTCLWACGCTETPATREAAPPGAEAESLGAFETRTCVRVVDGDTIVLDGKERVRYIGIDTPETVHPRKPVQWMGKEASAANRLLVEGKRVQLEYDAQRTDKYGRTLAYVYIDGVMVNELLVRAGYARVSPYPPNVKHVQRFQAAQREARSLKRGLWSEGAEPASDPLVRAALGETTPSPPAATQAVPRLRSAPTQPIATETCYITRTGKKYHRAGCQYLRMSMIPISKSDAIARGYGACKKCGP